MNLINAKTNFAGLSVLMPRISICTYVYLFQGSKGVSSDDHSDKLWKKNSCLNQSDSFHPLLKSPRTSLNYMDLTFRDV